jgi:hypothetical protein
MWTFIAFGRSLAGNIADITMAMIPLDDVARPKRFPTDNACDTDRFRDRLRKRRTKAVIPSRLHAELHSRLIARPIAAEVSLSVCSANPKTGDALQPDTTGTLKTTCQALSSPR